ncbi:DHA2 family efflux MFS transporter permease subunit [Dactylosporangium fulvum]|uniref:MFS transporter n=1 Tax=Dactylosporangium fulvum TaxID=53359 RepID=A0ABY5VRL7_9ACTN|nr:MFS transporter [Dactylosporangium fulvum]UWP79835.1 MFS transporter [Dactylosporangium fulvum]
MDQLANRWAGLAALLAGFFVILLDMTIVAVASPSIQHDLEPDVSGLFWVTAGYLLAFSVPLLVAGRLGDRYDPKRVFLAGMGGFAVASALCGLAPSIGWLVLFRVAQGLAAAAMAPQPLTLIRRLFVADERGRALGIWGSVAAAGTLLGPVLGGLLTAVLDWRWIFWVNVPLCGIALLMGLRWIPGSRGQTTRLDPLGAVTSTAGLGVLIWALLAWRDLSAPAIIAAVAVGAVLLAVFAFHERRMGPAALAPLGLYRSAGFRAASVAVAALGTAVIAMALPTMLYLQETRGLGPMEAALVMTPDAVVAAVLSPAAGRWVDRVGPRRPAILGMALLAASLLLIGLVVVLEIDPWWVALGAAVLGIANAVAWSPLSAAAMASVDSAAAGAASGMFSTVRQVTAVTGVATTGAVLAGLGSSPTLAFGVVFAVMAFVAVVGVVAATRLPRTSTEDGPDLHAAANVRQEDHPSNVGDLAADQRPLP